MSVIHQALYSQQNGKHELVSVSNSVCPTDLREMRLWTLELSPNSSVQVGPTMLFFHPLPSGNFALARLFPNKSLVHYLIITAKTLSEYANNPITLYNELQSLDLLNTARKNIHCRVPAISAPLRQGKTPCVNDVLLSGLVSELRVSNISQLLHSTVHSISTVFSCRRSSLDVVEGLLNLLPVAWRTEITFATNILTTPMLPFRLIGLNENNAGTQDFCQKSSIPYFELDNYEEAAHSCWKRPHFYKYSYKHSDFKHRFLTDSSLFAWLDVWSPFIKRVLQKKDFTFLRECFETDLMERRSTFEENFADALKRIALRWRNSEQSKSPECFEDNAEMEASIRHPFIRAYSQKNAQKNSSKNSVKIMPVENNTHYSFKDSIVSFHK